MQEASRIDYHLLREEGINRMADAIEEHLNMSKIYALCGSKIDWKNLRYD
ncbi:hypothetical protein [Endozoicomonas sp. YOMI1]|nr:hypothetical protein [Endozoicomonas sp. YOMI1]